MRHPSTPELAVIVPHHTSRELYQRCVTAIAASVGVTYEVWVVTSDPTLEADWVERTGWHLLYLEGGPALKRNVAAARTQAKYLVFLDDDVAVSRYCLYQLWRAMEETPRCGMGFCKILKMDDRRTFDDAGSWLTGTGFMWARASNGLIDQGQFDQPTTILASKSATCIVRRQAFQAVGGFDPTYFILGEESDLAWRLWLSGCEVWYFPSAVSYHAFDTPLKPKDQYYSLSRIHYLGARNYLWCLMTNLGTWKLIRILPLHLCGWLASCVGFTLKGDWPRTKLILKGLWDGLQPKGWWEKRKRVQSTRVVSDRQLWPLIACPPLIQIRCQPPLSYYVGRLRRYTTQAYHG